MSDRRRVDYDQIAQNFDRRYEARRFDGISDALDELLRPFAKARVLEVGCGTGHWLSRVAPNPGLTVGMDLSMGMLVKARPSGQPLVNASADALPFADRSFDCVYCLNAIHHFSDPRQFVRSAVKLLRPNGILAVIGMDPRTMAGWFVYEHFPGTFEADLRRFPSYGELVDWFIAGGLQQVGLRVVEHVSNPKRGADILADPFFRRDGCSQLALLTEDEFAAGFESVRAAAERNALFPAELPIAMVSGRVA